ncbi:MAG: hypothetical protein QXD03_02395 [Candidatus Anstonellales archaeon]
MEYSICILCQDYYDVNDLNPHDIHVLKYVMSGFVEFDVDESVSDVYLCSSCENIYEYFLSVKGP